MMIHSSAREEEMEKSLEAPWRIGGLLGQPSGKFDYKVFYSKPPSYDIPIESIVPEVGVMSLEMISQKVKRKELKFLSNHREELKICWASLRAILIIKYFILSQLLMTFLLK